MVAAKYFFVLFFVLLLCAIHPSQGRGGRGGGSRGGGSRGSSSGGSRSSSSRGSSSSSSSSRGSSSSGTQYDRSSSGGSKPSPPKTSADRSQPAQPSAPEPPKLNPSAPRLPESPGSSQPSNPNPYNPNFAQPARPGPSPNVPNVNPPSYGNAAPGNLPPYSPRQNPPPYSPGNPPPYAPGNPPYAPGNPPYAPGNPPYPQPGPGFNVPQPNAPPYGSGHPGNPPPYAPPPYGVNTGNIPQGPSYGQPPYGGVNRPNVPQGNPPPYGVNVAPPVYGARPGTIPQGGQPSNFPYPRQPGMPYPQGGSGWPNSYNPGGFQGMPNVEPHKKKGLLGGLLSLGKKPKHHGMGMGSPVGSFGQGGHGISPLHMMLPVAAMKKAHKPKFPSMHSALWVLPFIAHRRSFGGFGMDFDYDDDDYGRRRCLRPRTPSYASISCEHTLRRFECRARCQDGYAFPDNSTELEIHCWRYSGHWSRSRFLPACQPYCKPDECQNGGTCTAPGVCRCATEYRGDHCEHHIMNCDILKFAKGSKITWVCTHSQNETVCKVRCRSPLVFETPAAEQYHCHLNGTWTPDKIPQCREEGRSTEVTETTALPTEAP